MTIQKYLQEKTLDLIFNNQNHEVVKNLFLTYFSEYGFSEQDISDQNGYLINDFDIPTFGTKTNNEHIFANVVHDFCHALIYTQKNPERVLKDSFDFKYKKIVFNGEKYNQPTKFDSVLLECETFALQTKVLEYIFKIDNQNFNLKEYMEDYYLKSLRFLDDYVNIPSTNNQEKIDFCSKTFHEYYKKYEDFNIIDTIKKMVHIRNYKSMSNEDLLSLSKNKNFDLHSISHLIESKNKINIFLKEYINKNIQEEHLIKIIDNLQKNFENINFIQKNNHYIHILDKKEYKKINAYIYFFYENDKIFEKLNKNQKEKIDFFKKSLSITNSQEVESEEDFIFCLKFKNIPNFLNIKINKNIKKRSI